MYNGSELPRSKCSMKKAFIIISAVVISFVLLSCSHEVDVIRNQQPQFVETTTFIQPVTRSNYVLRHTETQGQTETTYYLEFKPYRNSDYQVTVERTSFDKLGRVILLISVHDKQTGEETYSYYLGDYRVLYDPSQYYTELFKVEGYNRYYVGRFPVSLDFYTSSEENHNAYDGRMVLEPAISLDEFPGNEPYFDICSWSNKKNDEQGYAEYELNINSNFEGPYTILTGLKNFIEIRGQNPIYAYVVENELEPLYTIYRGWDEE